MLDKDALAAQAERMNEGVVEAAPVEEENAVEVTETKDEENRIPYSRLQSAIHERNDLREQLEELRLENKRLQQEDSFLDQDEAPKDHYADELKRLRGEVETMKKSQLEEILHTQFREVQSKYPGVSKEEIVFYSNMKDNEDLSMEQLGEKIFNKRKSDVDAAVQKELERMKQAPRRPKSSSYSVSESASKPKSQNERWESIYSNALKKFGIIND